MACSERGAYEGLRAVQRLECHPLPPAAYEECSDATDRSYDEYRRARAQMLGGD